MNQQTCSHQCVVEFSRLADAHSTRVCSDCSRSLPKVAPSAITINTTPEGATIFVPSGCEGEVLVLIDTPLGGYLGAWSIKAGEKHPIQLELQRQLAGLRAPQLKDDAESRRAYYAARAQCVKLDAPIKPDAGDRVQGP